MIYFLYNYVSVHVSAVPREAIRGQQTPLELELSAVASGTVWVLETKPESSERATSALDC